MWLGAIQLVYFVASMVFFLAASAHRRWLSRLASGLGSAGVVAHVGYFVHRGLTGDTVPVTTTFETLVLFALLLMVWSLLVHHRYDVPALSGFAGLGAALVLAVCALMVPEIRPLLPALQSNFLLLHVLTCFLGYAAFGLAFAAAATYLCLDLGAGRLLPGLHVDATMDLLDWVTYRIISFGFPLLTLGIVTGSIWANESWGRYWNWDPKEAWSFITWLLYAACLHVRYTRWRERGTAIMTVVGFAAVVFTYLGVNYWLAGLHNYA